jgi:ferredoxin-nitrite reductase
MSSFGFLSPPLSSAPCCNTRQLGAATPAVAPVVTPDVDAARLEPRVEERDGYWVLKEKFTEGINVQEKVKIQRDPMKLYMEGGIEELANLPFEELDKAKDTKDDIDVRLKWLGLFHRRKHQCKFISSIFFDSQFVHPMISSICS